jgi:hypothetical protein
MTMFSMAGTTPDRTLSLIYGSGDTATIPETHPRFDELVTLLLSGAEDEEVSDLVDVMLAVSKRLEQLSERVSIRGRQVLFDGDALRGELADVLVELFEAGNPESLRPVVNFLEKASTNPSNKSIDDLYRWITKGDLLIHEDGDFLAYKGTRTDDEGLRTSISAGTAFVNGEQFEGYIPNPDGAVVTMPRSNVDDNENEACSTGLHAGTASYAFRFANDDTILVKINPRDVVSVPNDSSNQKLRVCRYVVQEVVEGRRESRLYIQEPLPVEVEDDSVVAFMAVLTDVPLPVWNDDEPDEEDEDEVDDDDSSAEEQEDMYSDDALERLRIRLASEDLEYQYSGLTEAQLEDQASENEVVRDSKGRFTPESAVKAVRNSKGQFTRES